MRILLLTDIPPCKNYTAGLVLDQLCRFLPRGSIACFAIVNPEVSAKLSPDLDWIPIAYARKRTEAAFLPSARKVGHVLRNGVLKKGTTNKWAKFLLLPLKFLRKSMAGASGLKRDEVPRLVIAYALKIFAYLFLMFFFYPIAWAVEAWRRSVSVPRLADRAVEFGSAQKVDLVWAVLQGQTLTQIAPDVARRLGAPLVTQVWDPLHWWLQANRIDPINRRAALADFDRALRASRTCIAASWAMAEDYEARYGTRSVPVISSYPKEWANSPDLCQFPRDEIEIGMAGQFYAGEEWLQLLRALNMSGWQVRGKSVTVTVMGASAPPGEAPPGRIRFLGWRDQKDAAELLSKLDVLYCAYPFAPGMAEVAKLSFPSKVVLYLAAGRPILFHGPALASPAVYLRDRAASLIVPDLHAAAVYNGLCRLVDNPELYVELGRNAQKAFLRDFELGSMRASFESALGVTIDRDVEQAPSDGSQMRHSGTGGVAKRTGRAALA